MAISLDALTARVQARVQEKDRLEKAKEQAKKAKSDVERRAANEAAAAIQSAIDWKPVALVLRSLHWQCRCGAEGDAPGGLFIFYEHTRVPNSTRLCAPRHSPVPQDLPRKSLVEVQVVSLCPTCGPEVGFRRPLKGS